MSPATARRSRRRPATLLGLVAVGGVVLAQTSVAGGVSAAVGAGPATPAAATPPPKSLSVHADPVRGLTPGVTRTVKVKVVNQHAGDVRLVRVVPVLRSGGATGLPASCPTEDFVLVGYAATATSPGPLLSKRGGSATVDVRVGMRNRAASQDGCKGLSFTIEYTATGQGK